MPYFLFQCEISLLLAVRGNADFPRERHSDSTKMIAQNNVNAKREVGCSARVSGKSNQNYTQHQPISQTRSPAVFVRVQSRCF